ncbi:MAG: hypothetical protein DI637_07575 [Citromicrobium sp.]|nr:MAG: hypothetical protein DI637_07575 [Citromicrobium sp.]
MTRSFFRLAAIGTIITAMTSPLAAQEVVEADDDSYNMVVVYGDDACPASTPDVIVVCARKAESERFRIPEELRFSDDPANQSWAERVEKLEMVGASGTMSCSPAGAGGVIGCTQKLIRDAYADKANSSSVRFSQIIADKRAERLSTIDADAERTQAEVEMIEREYMKRLERERAAEDDATDDALPSPTPTEPEVVSGDPEAR